VAPNVMPQPQPDAAGYTGGPAPGRTVASDVPGGEAQRLLNGRDIPRDWWRMFGSRPLRTLTERALRNNPDLAAAQAGLRVAQANLAAGKGAFFPSIDANFSASRQKPAISGPAEPCDNGNLGLPE